MRNALAHVPAKQRPAVMAMIKTIFAQETAAEAHAQWKTVADAVRERAPRLAEPMDEAREDVLAYTQYGSHNALDPPTELSEALKHSHFCPRLNLSEQNFRLSEQHWAYTAFPKEHWPQIASTNPLERLNGEVKRRSDGV